MRIRGFLTLLFFSAQNLANIEPTSNLPGSYYNTKDEDGVRKKSDAIDQSDRRLERTDDSNPPTESWDWHQEGQDAVDCMMKVGVKIGYVLLGLLFTTIVIAATFEDPSTPEDKKDQDKYDIVSEPEESDTDLTMNYLDSDGGELFSDIVLDETGTGVPRVSDNTEIWRNVSSMGDGLVHRPELQNEIVHFDIEKPITLPFVPKEPMVKSPYRRRSLVWQRNRSCSIDPIRSRSRTKSESVRSCCSSSNDRRFTFDEQLLNSSVKSPLLTKQGSLECCRLHWGDTEPQMAVNHQGKTLELKPRFFFKRGIGKRGSEKHLRSIPSETAKLLPSLRSASPLPISRKPAKVKDKLQWSLTTLQWPSLLGKNSKLALGKVSRNDEVTSRVDGEARYEPLPQRESNRIEDIKREGKHTEVMDTFRLLTNETLNISTDTSAPESLARCNDGSPKNEETKQLSLDKEREINSKTHKGKGLIIGDRQRPRDGKSRQNNE